MKLLPLFERWLGVFAKKTIAREKPIIVAITGSVGKSSTKNALSFLLDPARSFLKVRVSRKNYNNELGLPLTIFHLPAPGRSMTRWMRTLLSGWMYSVGLLRTGVELSVLEMGADKPGDLRKLCEIAPPNIVIITAVMPEGSDIVPVHAANYPSIAAVAEEKSTLIKCLQPGGSVILNADDQEVFAMRHITHERVFTFGQADGTDVRIVSTNLRMESSAHGFFPLGLEITLESFNRVRKIFLPGVFGTSIAYALAAAFTVSAVLDLPWDPQDMIDYLADHYQGLPGRTRIIPGMNSTIILDDAYNASPAGMLSAIRDLGNMPLQKTQRRVACLGEMRELGDQSEAMHRLVGAEVAKQKIDLLIACGTLAHVMRDGALVHGMSQENIRVFTDSPEAGLFLRAWLKPGDMVLVKASEGKTDPRGCRMERVVKDLMADPRKAKELLCRQESSWKKYS
ncbi:UDP-N-acetylmuramoyl-tripeptide--D-alanyl-D-alanine ligase [Candidatus Uhrbacteria bacterium]|nr:UDP-N-acetylmuramoyl-tripeptide--D-alanyl-D-alanine ligase [Candidatus Uhrbacteria bacterium]